MRILVLRGDALDLNVQIKSIPKPRREAEDHYYNAAHSGLMDLGLEPNYMTQGVSIDMHERIIAHKDAISHDRTMPRISWS